MKKHGDYSVFRYVRVIMVILGVLGMLNIGLILFTISASQTEQNRLPGCARQRQRICSKPAIRSGLLITL